MSHTEKVPDPRLCRILGVKKEKRDENFPPLIASPDPVPPKSFLTDPRSSSVRTDPRRRREEPSPSTTHISSPSSNTSMRQPREGQLEMQQLLVMLQKSAWYQDLNSSSKIAVNQQLALLSAELKKFSTDPSPDKVFDLTYVTSNPTLQHILTSLGVYMDENGYFCQVEDSPKETGLPPALANLLSQPPPSIPTALPVPPNIDILNSLVPMLGAPPPRLPLNANARGSLLGFPPHMSIGLNESILKFLPNANAIAHSLLNSVANNAGMCNNGSGGNRNDRDDRDRDRDRRGSNQQRDQDRRGNWGNRNNNRRNDYGNHRRKN